MSADRECAHCGKPVYWHDILRGWFHRHAGDQIDCGRDTYPKAES